MENTNNKAVGNKAAGSRSTFVSVVAWIFIALSAISLLSGLMVDIVFNVAFRGALFQQMSAAAEQHLPPLALFMFHHVRWLITAFLVISLVELLAAIGLLLRKEWGRRLFILFMAGAILWKLVNLVFQFAYPARMHAVPFMPATVPADITHGFQVFGTVMEIFSAVVAVGFCVLYGWIIKRLVSPKIRAEFA